MCASETYETIIPNTNITHGADLVPAVREWTGTKDCSKRVVLILHYGIFCISDSPLISNAGGMCGSAKQMRLKHSYFQPPTAFDKAHFAAARH